jgi:hypothetical protein
VGEGSHHRDLRRIEPLVGHGHCDQERRKASMSLWGCP